MEVSSKVEAARTGKGGAREVAIGSDECLCDLKLLVELVIEGVGDSAGRLAIPAEGCEPAEALSWCAGYIGSGSGTASWPSECGVVAVALRKERHDPCELCRPWELVGDGSEYMLCAF